MKIIAAALAIIVAASPAFSTEPPHTAKKVDWSKLPWFTVCAKARRGNSDALQEIVLRNQLPAAEVAFVARGEVFVGMTEAGAACATGGGERMNRTVTARGESLQVVFPEGRKIKYLYLENGRVTAWQE